MIRSVPHPIEILFGNGVGLACALNGDMNAEDLNGLFAGDTRVLSTWRFTIGGHRWQLLARSRPDPSTAQWEMQNPPVRTPGGELPEGTLRLRLRRRVAGALHDDLTVCAYVQRPILVRLALQIDADFADLFEVKDRRLPPRLGVQRVANRDGVTLSYQRGDFRRALHVVLTASAGDIASVGAQLVFDVMLERGREWRCCLEATPELDGKRIDFDGDPHASEAARVRRTGVWIEADPLLSAPFRRGCEDLERLSISSDGSPPYIAAGAPWFLALFGRDTLVTSLMAGLLGSWHARGALDALGHLQARERDDFRDAEPGKIPHELRCGELAHTGVVPHTPYYGTHDAPALYVLALWNAFRWTGDRELLERHMPSAAAALRWCEQLGDRDGDGFLEYATRSRAGYRNQGWKDAGDAVPYLDGRHAELPIATVELQGYLFAAQLAFAELLDATGERAQAATLRSSAHALRTRVEDRFWMEDEGCYAMALDGRKQLVRSISSNPGHLLWCGLPSPARARRTAARLLAPDMFSGYGVRTLTSQHACYNPLSYQLGSVWPHDNALIAAGLMRYGLRDEATRTLEGILAAALDFEHNRLPELFCGFARAEGPPVPYAKANVPQAWAAAAALLAAQILIGFLPDAPNGRCYVDPWLPDWLPSLEISGIEIGGGTLRLALRRETGKVRIEASGDPPLDIIERTPPAPLWGAPLSHHT